MIALNIAQYNKLQNYILYCKPQPTYREVPDAFYRMHNLEGGLEVLHEWGLRKLNGLRAFQRAKVSSQDKHLILLVASHSIL